jgi:hypothetical protein
LSKRPRLREEPSPTAKNFFKNAFHHQEVEKEEHGFAQLKHTNMNNNRYAKSEVGG